MGLDTIASAPLVQNVSAVLDELGRRFGATGAHLWAALVRYEYIKALTILIVTCGIWTIFFAIFAFSFRLLFTNSDRQPSCETEDLLASICGVAGFVVLLSTLAGFVLLAESVATIYSPEAAVLHNILP